MESEIKLIVGLGNPGPAYEKTRHNVGFWLVKSLAEKYQGSFKLDAKFKSLISTIKIIDHECSLLLPQTFMNLSGQAVSSLINFYKISPEAILVVHDELDFLPGVARLKKGGSANGHNGVQNIIDLIGSNNFWRLRIGIGKSNPGEDPSSYVTSTPNSHDRTEILSAIDRAIQMIPLLAQGNFAKAMLDLHVV